MKVWVAGLCVMVLVLAVSNVCLAQVEAGTRELSGYVGILMGDDVGNITDDGVDFRSGAMDDSVSFGGRFGYNFTEVWGVEVALGYVSLTDFNTIATDGVTTLTIATGTDQVHFHGNVLYHLNLSNPEFVPYITAGIGGVYFSGSTSALGVTIDYDETDFAWNIGGGLKWYLNDTIILRADVRDIVTSLEDMDTMHMIEATMGITKVF